MEQLTDTLKDLKSNKASGLDKIRNEFIKASTRSMRVIILNFANLMSKKGLVPKSWCLDLITPLLKEGDKESPENYRGLSIMNTLLKLVCTMMCIVSVQWEQKPVISGLKYRKIVF